MGMWLVFGSSCKPESACVVTQYGPEYMTYQGSASMFGDACRKVLHDLSHKEQIDSNQTEYPYYGEGVSSQSANGRNIAVKGYMKTQDDDGAEYKITILTLGTREPVVLLESTSEDSHKLVNAINAEFAKRKIKVIQY